MADTSVLTPDFTATINQQFFIEPLNAPANPATYLDIFPEEVYNTSADSHLARFMYALLGPAGVGWLRKDYLQARLLLEEYGVQLTDLDDFYGDPLRFGRILEETYNYDLSGVLTQEQWNEIRAKDAAYRSRALDYVRGLRLGNTPKGMQLVARSGLGHDVELFEQYRYIYDQHSDDPLLVVNQGITNSTEEVVVLPRRELARSEIQRLSTTGLVTGGTFILGYQTKITDPINWNASNSDIRLALEAILGGGNVVTEGGPFPNIPIDVYFKGDLANQDTTELSVYISLTGDVSAGLIVDTLQGGVEANEEFGNIPPRDQHYLMTAIQYLKPQTTLVTFQPAQGISSRTIWNGVFSGSTYAEVVRYVIGRSDVPWPTNTLGGRDWIESGVEHQGRRAPDDLQYHYAGFHNISAVYPYNSEDENTNIAQLIGSYIPAEHIGNYSAYQVALYPILANYGDTYQAKASYAPATYPEPSLVTAQQNGSLVNGIYPIEYQTLPNVNTASNSDGRFWSSTELPTGDVYLELDLGTAQAVNKISFETLQKPLNISVTYDILDQYPFRVFHSVQYTPTLPNNLTVGYSPSRINPWQSIELNIEDEKGNLIFTRFVRLKFSRRNDDFFTKPTGELVPFSIDVKNLRVGRVVS